MIVFLFFLFNINTKLTFFVIIFCFILYIFTIFSNGLRKKKYIQVCRKNDRCNSYLIESLNSADTIKGGHIEKKLVDKFFLLYRDLLEKSYVYSLCVNIYDLLKTNMRDLLFLFIYGVGGILILRKEIDIGDIFLYQTFLMYFLNSFIRVNNLVDEYSNFKIVLCRVEDLYTISKEKFFGSYYYYAYNLVGDIVFNKIFYKVGSKIILNGISLTIRKGTKVLLTGASGVGESSLVKILMRYIEVPYGMCCISGIDINHYHLENIRKNISYVTSNEFLFTDSIYNNITLGREVSEEEFIKVIEITNVKDIVNAREKDVHMLVEENGFNFSNGEKQRIILSRYLLKNSNIYIFDEALSQLDVSMEKEILRKLFLYLKDKTVIVISHRLDNKKMFDKVYLLKSGNIYEEKI